MIKAQTNGALTNDDLFNLAVNLFKELLAALIQMNEALPFYNDLTKTVASANASKTYLCSLDLSL